MRIGILFTAFEPLTDLEREHGLAVEDDLETVEAVEQALRGLGHHIKRLPLGDNIDEWLAELRSLQPDMVFNLMDDFRGTLYSQVNVIALLDLVGLRYTGSGAAAFALSTDKALTKSVLAHRGIRVPRFQVAHKTKFRLEPNLSFPLIVKPLYEGGSYGISDASIVDSPAAAEERVRWIDEQYRQPSILEEYIDGREINAAILDEDTPTVLPLSEITFRNFSGHMHKVCGFRAKWETDSFEYRNTVPVCPAALPSDLRADIEKMALNAHLALGCRDYSRVDLRLDEQLRPYVIEVNANPDISPASGYVRSLLKAGRSYPGFVAGLADRASSRQAPNSPRGDSAFDAHRNPVRPL